MRGRFFYPPQHPSSFSFWANPADRELQEKEPTPSKVKGETKNPFFGSYYHYSIFRSFICVAQHKQKNSTWNTLFIQQKKSQSLSTNNTTSDTDFKKTALPFLPNTQPILYSEKPTPTNHSQKTETKFLQQIGQYQKCKNKSKQIFI